MKRKNVIVPVLLMGLMAASFTGFNQQSITAKQMKEDTLPVKQGDKKIRDLDDAINEVDRGFDQLNKIDETRIKAQLDQAMKNLDAAKIQMEMDKAIKEIDMSKVKADLDKAMKEVNSEKMKAQIEAAIAKVDVEKIKKQIEVQKIDLRKAEEQLKKVQPQIEQSMKEARKSLEKAKAELLDYKSFTTDLEKDGLIDTKREYSVKQEDGGLYINGQKQSDAVYNRYKSFLEKHKDFKIEKSADSFNIQKNK